jgi:hypothetical protein
MATTDSAEATIEQSAIRFMSSSSLDCRVAKLNPSIHHGKVAGSLRHAGSAHRRRGLSSTVSRGLPERAHDVYGCPQAIAPARPPA